jgi:uncharacterized protein RhaS with RHS repeats
LYDSEIGRFLGVDPLASNYPAWSPYNYVLGNPISKVDPDGRASEDCCGGGSTFALGYSAHLYGQEGIDRHTKGEASVALGMVAAVGLLYAAPIVGPYLLEKGGALLAIETSGTTIATNVTTDALIQTVINVANGNDPVENYDIIGGMTSAIANPIVGSAIDGALDVSLSGAEVNSPEEILINTVVGGALGKGSGKIAAEIPANAGRGKEVFNLISGIYTNGLKAAGTGNASESPAWSVPFVTPENENP